MSDSYKSIRMHVTLITLLFIFFNFAGFAQYKTQIIEIDANQIAWGESGGAVLTDEESGLLIEDILAFQLNLLNMNPIIQHSIVGMLVFVYTSANPFYLTIGAQRQATGFTFVSQNFYIAAATIATIVAIRFNLAQLGITPGTPWPPSELLKIFFHFSPVPMPAPGPEFFEFDLAVNQLDDDASNEYSDATPPNEPMITEQDPPPNFNSPIVLQHHYGCDVPNIDLDSQNNPSTPTYAGDKNACGPAAASNSLKWLEQISPDINIPFSHRALLDSLSRYMGRQPNSGVSIENFIKGKLDFIKAHNLPIQVKFQGQGVNGNIFDSQGQTFARNDNTGDYPTYEFLKQEMADSEDVELFYKWWDGSNWRGHVVTATGVYETQDGKKYVGMKHDLTQARADSKGTVQEFPEITTDAQGRLVIHRKGVKRYVAHIVSESPGPPFGGPTNIGNDISAPEGFYLAQNYPNPFNPGTNIEFTLPERAFVTLKVYDILGREVAVLVNEERLPGVHYVNFEPADLAGGVYFYKLTAGSYSVTRKMSYLK